MTHQQQAHAVAYAALRNTLVIDDEAQPAPMCPACVGGDGAYLGTLGRSDWFRCTACGNTFREVQA